MPSSTWKRTILLSGCCLLFVALMAASLGTHGAMDVVYRVALLFVLPLWLALLPLAIKVRDAKGSHLLLILGWGTLAGPVVLLLLFLVQMLNGGNPSIVWQGYPTVRSTVIWMSWAAVCSLFVCMIYGVSLRTLYAFSRQRSEGT